MSSRKRRRTSRDLRGVSFPDHVDPGARGVTSARSAARSWRRCGDSFSDCPVLKTPGGKLSAVRKLAQFHSAGCSEDSVQIAWSDSDQSDGGGPRAPPPSSCAAPPTCTPDKDVLLEIDTDSEVEEGGDGEQLISDCDSEPEGQPGRSAPPAPPVLSSPDVEICGSSSHSDGSPPSGRPSLPLAAEGGRRPLSEWLRSAQALLQTPQKQTGGGARTPEDSGRKRRKFSSGGLAERLSRLQSRQRSAVSFWKHQSDPSAAVTSSAERPGVLQLEVQEVHQEGAMQLARCGARGLRPPGDQATPVLVLFDRETTAQLKPAPGDQIRVHPPWQSLSVDGLRCPVVLNTHFSQTVDTLAAARHAARRRPPHHLSNTFSRPEVGRSTQQAADSSCLLLLPAACRRRCSSLLEAIEGLGQAGCVEQEVEVVVQRVYCSSVSSSSSSAGSLLRSRRRSSAPPPPPPVEGGGARLCVLVQDHDGTFSVVQLHLLPSRDLLQQYCLRWQGRNCSLRGVKVVQRLTRERSSRLFSLIDSLWPSLIPLPHSPPPLVAPTDSRPAGPPPSFCYLLSGQTGSVRPAEARTPSPLYVPPAERNLRDVLQSDETTCCSFRAAALHTRTQGGDGVRPDLWLVLTDRSLQEDGPAPPRRRTLPLCIKPSCVLTSSVLAALRSPGTLCRVAFRDVLREHGVLLCVEQSVVELVSGLQATTAPEAWALPRPLRLDPLGLEVAPCSLCWVSGVIVSVDEDSAFSWPTCCHCGSDDLETSTDTQRAFLCVACGCAVSEPNTRIHLEVHLSCSSLAGATVKVKLQHRTILSVLQVAPASSSELRLSVDDVLGEQLGPIPAFVRVLTRTPSLWIGLDEVCL